MPDTHLAMPRTLSAPYAELLEAEAPRTTTSDALPNGTAAAAVAFARLLASGDHAMQPDSYTLTGNPALPPQARDTVHHSSDLRATLLGSTAIPADGHPDAEILDLGRRRTELIQRINQSGRPGHDAAPLLIEWKEVDQLIMELEPKTAAGLAVQLSAIWSLSPEPDEKNGPTADGPLERTWLWTAMKNAERIGASASLAHDRQDTDAPIFAAYSRWSELVQDCYAAKTDDDCERLSEQADEAALDVMTHEPATREGLAAQVFVMLHLEHGGTTDDHLDIDFSPLTGGDGPDNAAVQALVERVKRIGRRDGAYEPYAAAMEKRIGTAANDQLRQAWEELYRLDTECVPDDLDDWAACEAYNRSVDEACKRVLAAPVQTVADIGVFARFALRGVTIQWGACETEPQELAARDQIPTDRGQQLMVALWRIVERLTEHHKVIHAAHVVQQNADAFADTVAAFEAEAPATLALPLEPTGRMVDAGASAAGITPAQFQAAYAAAVEALKLERAA